jgi:hypothetical protein
MKYKGLSDEEVKDLRTSLERVNNGKSLVSIRPGPLESLRPHRDIQIHPHIGHLQNIYDPNRGQFSSTWQRWKAEARAKLLTALIQETDLLIALWSRAAVAIQAEFHTQTLLERLEREEELAKETHNNQIAVLKEATRLKMDVATYQQVIMQQSEIDKEILLEQERSRLRIIEASHQNSLEINKHERFKEIDVEHEEKIANLKKMMLEFKEFLPVKRYEKLQKKLKKVIKGYHTLKTDADTPQKKAELKRLKGQVKAFQMSLKELEKELV